MQEEHVAVADGENEVRHTDYIYMDMREEKAK